MPPGNWDMEDGKEKVRGQWASEEVKVEEGKQEVK